MNSTPLVSLVVVNYNFSAYVIQTLESVRQQTYANTELVIIDDLSTDNSPKLIRDWLATYDKPYKFVANEKNLGVCATVNKAFHLANGKYISATAGDDLFQPQKVETQVAMLESSGDEFCAVYSNAYLINEHNEQKDVLFIERRKVKGYPSGYIYEDLLEDNFIPAMSALLKKSCFLSVGDFDETLAYEDYDMWLRLAHKYKFLFSDYVSCTYRVKEKSLSTSITDWDLPNASILAKHAPTHPLAMKKLKELAFRAYTRDKTKVLETLSSKNINNKYVKRLLYLHRKKIPVSIGKHLLPKIG